MTGLSVQHLTPWLLSEITVATQAGLRIILVFLAGYVGVRFIRGGLRHLETILVKAGEGTEPSTDAIRRRVTTLLGVLRTIALALLWSVVLVISLDQIGLDITPILTGAGIIGLAVGFGAQNLVRDVISGFFIVLEDQVRVGDVAVINGTGGQVESITFRTIVLRDVAGVVHVFPNGTINTLANMTKTWSAYVLDIGVAYKEDTDRVVAVMRQVAADLGREPDFRDKILEPIEIFGVDEFGDSSVVIKARLKTRPMEQWAVGREYRRRLKKTFDAQGIEFPFPNRTLWLDGAGGPLRVRLDPAAGTVGS